MNTINRQVTLRRYPQGMPALEDFQISEGKIPIPTEDQVLCKAVYLTVDPYIRARLVAKLAQGYSEHTKLGVPIPGEAVSQVVESRNPAFKAGDFVAGFSGWQDYAALPGEALRKLDPTLAPLPAHLGTLGMPGLTAYAGFTRLADAQAGQTVFVSAALGGVGAVVGQLARIKGCRVVGVSSTPEKCRYAVDELGYDICLDRTQDDFAAQLAKACPDGIDVDFENAGGPVFWAVLNNMNNYGRMVICGLISAYNDDEDPIGRDLTPSLLREIALRRLILKGLMVADFWDLRPQFLSEVGAMIRDGRFKHKEYIVEGIENAGAAMIDMMSGRNFGKTVVRIADDPLAGGR